MRRKTSQFVFRLIGRIVLQRNSMIRTEIYLLAGFTRDTAITEDKYKQLLQTTFLRSRFFPQLRFFDLPSPKLTHTHTHTLSGNGFPIVDGTEIRHRG